MNELRPGDVFDRRYRVVAELGRGGFAVVYLGEHVEIGHRVAIKLLHADRSDARFVREGKILVQLRSPHTVRMLDFGRTDAQNPFIVCDYVEGTTLDDAIRANGAMAPDRAMRIAIQILESLSEAHALGIVHRDLKPSNVMLTGDDEVRVLDFGIAKLLPNAAGLNPALTSPGFTVGTPAYMAPEQLAGARLGPPTDLFALGLIVWELLFGRQANDSKDRMRAAARQFGRRYSFAGSAVEPSVQRFLESMCAQSVRHRPRDGAHALEQLRSCWKPGTQPTASTPPPTALPAPDETSSSTQVETPRGEAAPNFATWAEGVCWTIDGRVMWAVDGAETTVLPLPPDFRATCIAPCGANRACVGSNDGRVGWFDSKSTFDSVDVGAEVTAVATGTKIYAGTVDGAVFCIVDGRVVQVDDVGQSVDALAVTRANDMVAVGSGSHVLLRDLRAGTQKPAKDLGETVLAVVFSPDDYLLAILTPSELIVANALTLDSMVRFRNNRGHIVAIRFTTTGQLQTVVLTGGELHVAPVE